MLSNYDINNNEDSLYLGIDSENLMDIDLLGECVDYLGDDELEEIIVDNPELLGKSFVKTIVGKKLNSRLRKNKNKLRTSLYNKLKNRKNNSKKCNCAPLINYWRSRALNPNSGNLLSLLRSRINNRMNNRRYNNSRSFTPNRFIF